MAGSLQDRWSVERVAYSKPQPPSILGRPGSDKCIWNEHR